MMNNYQKVALVTGAAKRIGAALAKALHAAGYKVLIHYRTSEKEAQNLVQALNQNCPNTARLYQADLNDYTAYEALIQAAIVREGRLDVLINNASEYFPTPLGAVDEPQWQALINSNLKAPYFLSQAAAPWLKKTGGAIVNLSDSNAFHPKKNFSLFCIAKAGLNMLTQSLSKELAPDIRVNAIAPMSTLWAEGPWVPTESRKKQIIEETLLKRKTAVSDIINTLFFILNQQSMTGEIIKINCGKLLYPF